METAIGRDIRRVTHTLGPSLPAGRIRRDDGPAAVVTGIPEGCVDPRRHQQIGSRTLPARTSLPGQINPRYTPVHTSDSEVTYFHIARNRSIIFLGFFFNHCICSFQPSLDVDVLLPYTVHNGT